MAASRIIINRHLRGSNKELKKTFGQSAIMSNMKEISTLLQWVTEWRGGASVSAAAGERACILDGGAQASQGGCGWQDALRVPISRGVEPPPP